MVNKNKILSDLSKIAVDAMSTFSGLKKEVETLVSLKVNKIINKMNLVKRDEFDVLKKMVQKVLIENDELKKALKKHVVKKKKIIPHIKLSGVIGNVGKFKQGIDFSGQEEIISKAFALKKAPCVAITINSPGGSPVQSHLIYNFIRQQAKKNKKKVIVFAEDVAASGGYMLMCAGDKLFANKSSIVGSIGVISASFGFKKLIDKIGIKRRVFTKGDRKSFLDPFENVSKKDVDKLIKVQDSIFENFKGLVTKSRKKKIDPKKVFNGEFWTGEQAKELGLVDSNDDIDSYLKKTYGKKIKIRNIESKKSFIKGLIGGKSSQLNLVGDLEETIKESSYWGRYGL